MHPELEQLLFLQDRQQKIRQIENEIKTLPLQRKSLETHLASSVAAVEALKHKAQHVEIERKKLELDVGTRNDSIARLRTQQYETRKNDEFQAMGNEIKRYENEILKIEDEELELMERGDNLKAARQSSRRRLPSRRSPSGKRRPREKVNPRRAAAGVKQGTG